MTKKTTTLVNKYQERINAEVWMFENGFIDFDKAHERIVKEEKMFEEMLTSMYYYGMISDKDHKELSCIPSNIRFEADDKLLNIKYFK